MRVTCVRTRILSRVLLCTRARIRIYFRKHNVCVIRARFLYVDFVTWPFIHHAHACIRYLPGTNLSEPGLAHTAADTVHAKHSPFKANDKKLAKAAHATLWKRVRALVDDLDNDATPDVCADARKIMWHADELLRSARGLDDPEVRRPVTMQGNVLNGWQTLRPTFKPTFKLKRNTTDEYAQHQAHPFLHISMGPHSSSRGGKV
jgi:hypothetical protein